MGGAKGAEMRTTVHIPHFDDQAQVKVVCNGVPAIFLVEEKNFACRCPACLRRESRQGPRATVFTPTEYERHAGMAASKKWKYSVRVDDEVANPDGQQLTIGRWLDEVGEPHRKTATGRVRPGGVPVSNIAGRTAPTISSESVPRARPSQEQGPNKGGREAPPTAGTPRNSGMPPPAKPGSGARMLPSRTKSRSSFARSRSPSRTSEAPPAPDRSKAAAGGSDKLRLKFARVNKPAPLQDLQIPRSERLSSPPCQEQKRWMLTQEQVAEQQALHADVPPTPVQHKVSRVGADFQALVPGLLPCPSKTKREPAKAALPDKRIGIPGPSEDEALAIARGEELEQALSKPRDAIADVHEEEGWVDPRTVAPQEVVPGILDRSQRVRKRPGWLQGENLYGIRRRTRGESEAERAEPEEEEEDQDANQGQEEENQVAGKGRGLGRSRSARARTQHSKGTAKGGSARGREEEEDEDDDEEEAQLQNWLLSDDRQVLSVAVVLDGVTYSGRLEAVGRLPRPGRPGPGRRNRRTNSQPRLADSTSSAQQDDDMEDDADNRGYGGSRKGHRMADPPGSNKRPRPTQSEDQEMAPTTERQRQAEERFRQMAEDGAPPGTLCSLCHLEEDETVVYQDPEEGSEVKLPLGNLLLVRTSTITHAWVHDECARWCPEVHEEECSEDEGEEMVRLEGLPEAVRRGRRIKCSVCGQKGATLGCHARGCRRSFHLSCACVSGCTMVEDTYAAYCTEHAHLYRANGEEARDQEEGYWEDQQGDSQSDGAADEEVAANILGTLHRSSTTDSRALQSDHKTKEVRRADTNGRGKQLHPGRGGKKVPSSPPLPSFLTAALAAASNAKGLPPAPVRSKKAAAALAASAAAKSNVIPGKSYQPGGGLISQNSFGTLADSEGCRNPEEDEDADFTESDGEQPPPQQQPRLSPKPVNPPPSLAGGSSFTQRITEAVRASVAATAGAPPAFPTPSLQDMMKGAVHEVLKEFREKAAAGGSFNAAMSPRAPSISPLEMRQPPVAPVPGPLGATYFADAFRAAQQRQQAAAAVSPAAAALLAAKQAQANAAARAASAFQPPPGLPE